MTKDFQKRLQVGERVAIFLLLQHTATHCDTMQLTAHDHCDRHDSSVISSEKCEYSIFKTGHPPPPPCVSTFSAFHCTPRTPCLSFTYLPFVPPTPLPVFFLHTCPYSRHTQRIRLAKSPWKFFGKKRVVPLQISNEIWVGLGLVLKKCAVLSEPVFRIDSAGCFNANQISVPLVNDLHWWLQD